MGQLMTNVSTAAYVAGVSERDVNRIFDEALLPSEVIRSSRTLTPLGCVLASFYFREAPNLTADFRKSVVILLCKRGDAMRGWDALNTPSSSDWDIELGTLLIHIGQHVQETHSRMLSLSKAESLVESNPSIFDGEPIFKGTRVPVRTIAAWIGEGADRERIRDAYPHVTDEMVSAAPVWVKTHPAKGRPRKFGEINPDWKVKSSSSRKLGGQ
jgi:uncharacterized protein (DUF433 family)